MGKFDEVIEDSDLKLQNLRELYKFDYDAMLEEKVRLENEINLIEKAKHTPYFARIDFKNRYEISGKDFLNWYNIKKV